MILFERKGHTMNGQLRSVCSSDIFFLLIQTFQVKDTNKYHIENEIYKPTFDSTNSLCLKQIFSLEQYQ